MFIDTGKHLFQMFIDTGKTNAEKVAVLYVRNSISENLCWHSLN